jgi:hypothetical protein
MKQKQLDFNALVLRLLVAILRHIAGNVTTSHQEERCMNRALDLADDFEDRR